MRNVKRLFTFTEITVLIIISVFAYLVHIKHLSYYRDDWYYMYDGLVGGGKIFIEMFRHLRPARGPLLDLLFYWFGNHPQPYLILLYIWRLLGGLGALWLFRLLWPHQRSATFFMALFYLLYPGFLWWVQGFEYQPMVLSATLQIYSIIFTLKAVQFREIGIRILWLLLTLITGWIALAFVEYSIGMELFRWLCVYLLLKPSGHSPRKIVSTLRAAYPNLLIPLGFLFWHQFLFENARKAADLGIQVGSVLDTPSTGIWWMIHFFQSLLNVSFFAWITPFYDNFFDLRLKDTLFALLMMFLVLLIVYLANHFVRRPDSNENEPDLLAGWQLEAILLGLVGVGAGVLPIIIANRSVTFDRFSHYALPASLAAVSSLTGLLYLLADRRVRMIAASGFLSISMLTHAGVAFHARAEERLIQEFWHQVTWRISHLKPGTVLLVNYAGMDYREGNDIIWGPANFIYYPDAQKEIPIEVHVAAARMESDTPKNILESAQLEQNYIVVNNIKYDFDNLLVLTLPSENSCVHVLDGNWSEVSITDPALVALAAPRSDLSRAALDRNFPIPVESVFGAMPAQGWCYYYQQAQRLRQLERWADIMGINDQVTQLGLHPNDQVEWMPFLQAAAATQNIKLVKQISTRINTEQLYKQQACRNLKAMDLATDMQAQVNHLFCRGGTN